MSQVAYDDPMYGQPVPKTGGITDTQSYAYVIRNIFHDALAADPFFANYTIRKTKMLPVEKPMLPHLGIYLMRETMTPDGDANAGFIRFEHTVHIGFSVMIAHNDPDIAEQTLDAAFWKIMNVLWCHQTIMNMFGTKNPDNVAIESIVHGERVHVFGAAALNNETPIAEMQYDVSAFFRTMWWPSFTNDFNTLVIRTGVKPGDTQTEMDQRQQIEMDYDMTQQPPQPPATRPPPGPFREGFELVPEKEKNDEGD